MVLVSLQTASPSQGCMNVPASTTSAGRTALAITEHYLLLLNICLAVASGWRCTHRAKKGTRLPPGWAWAFDIIN